MEKGFLRRGGLDFSLAAHVCGRSGEGKIFY
jgi:hypothetical protein